MSDGARPVKFLLVQDDPVDEMLLRGETVIELSWCR